MTDTTPVVVDLINDVAAFLPLGRQVSAEEFDQTLFKKLSELETATQQQPHLRDVFRKRCFELCAFELNSSPLLRRIRYKPLGYPADFEVLEMLFARSEPTFWETFIQRQGEVQDVQHVTLPPELLARQGQTLLLLNSMYSSVQTIAVGHHLHVLEPEPKALEYAKTILTGAHFYERLEPALHSFDIIYAPYLLHRLHSHSAEQVLQDLWQRLKPGGTMVLYHLQEQHDLRLFMQWCLDWTLEYHDLARLETIAQRFESDLVMQQQGQWWRLELQKSTRHTS